MDDRSCRTVREHCPVEEGELRLLSVREAVQAYCEGAELAADGRERALCSNACLIAMTLEREGRPIYRDGQEVLERLDRESIARLAGQWAQFNREANPSALRGEAEIEGWKKSLKQSPYARLQWRVLRTFGALPTERRAREMKDRDYLWCALNLVLDREEELDRLCPQCRAEAEKTVCPVCGSPEEDWGYNAGFDRERFEELRERRGDE